MASQHNRPSYSETSMNAMTLAITALSHAGYDVFFGIEYGIDEVVARKKGTTYSCLVKLAIEQENQSPVLRVGKVRVDTRLLIAARPSTEDVWIIPFEDVAELSCIRLGKRWEQYRVRVSITTEEDEVDKENLVRATEKAVEAVKEK